jgi:drug/metabolite transporter (DMT)-like permease
MSAERVSTPTKIFIALGLVYIIWGSTYLGVKIAMHTLPPMLLSAVRFLSGGLILFIFSLLSGNPLPKFENWKGAAVVGFLLLGVGNSSVANAIKFMPSGLVALLVATLPAWTILLDFLFFSRKKPSWISVFGLSLGFGGMAFLLNPFQSGVSGEIVIFPTLLVIIGSIVWAYASLLSPTFKMPPVVQAVAVQMLAGGSFSLVISLFMEDNQLSAIQSMTQETYLAMAYLIFIGSFIGYSAFSWLINNAPAQLTATYAYVNPVVAIFLGWLLVDEHLTSRSLIASGIILCGVFLMTLGRNKQTDTKPTERPISDEE